MKRNLLEPTDDNIKKTLTDNILGRNDKVVNFLEILDCIDDNFSIALNSNWGNGKTFFVKQVKYLLDCINSGEEENLNFVKTIFNPEILTPYKNLCVYYDAWSNDDTVDPTLSFVYEIARQENVIVKLEKDKSLSEKLKNIASIFDLKLTGIIELLSNVDELKKIKDEKSLKEKINDFFDTLLPEKAERLVVIIDELDRCKPDFAVRLLERVKHYFYNPKITFVFAINITELQHTVRNVYGSSFNGLEYLDRFFDLRLELPTYIPESYFNFIELPNDMESAHIIPRIIINAFSLSLREINRFLSIYKLSRRKFTGRGNSWDMGNLFCVTYILPLMIVLKLKDTERYNNFITGNGFEELNIYDNEAKKIMGFFDTKTLSYKGILSNVYKTIFNYSDKDENSIYGGKTFGKCIFKSDTKGMLLKSVSLLDGFAQAKD